VALAVLNCFLSPNKLSKEVMMRGIAFLAAVLLLLFLLCGVQPAAAHAEFVRSDPVPGAVLSTSPREVRLWFSEPLEAQFSYIRLVDTSGNHLDMPASGIDSTDNYQMFIRTGTLPNGLYTVVWRGISAADGHGTNGSFTFTVGRGVNTSTSAAQTAETIPADGTLIRALNLLCMSLVLGSIGFRVFVWNPATRHAEMQVGMQSMMILGWCALGVAIIFSLMLQVSIAAGVPLSTAIASPALGQVVTDTRYGPLWLLRFILWVCLGMVLVLAAMSTREILYTVALGIGALLVFVHSLYSHASADSLTAVTSNWLHVFLTALWIGGLVQFFLAIPHVRQQARPPTPIISLLVDHFSNFGRVVVMGLLITGLYAAWLQVGSTEALFTTLYGSVLLLKMLLIAPLLLIAGVNLVYTGTALRAGRTRWIGRLRGLIGAEIALLLGVLLTVGAMTSITPARSAHASASVISPISKPYTSMQVVNDVHILLTISPNIVGQNTFEVWLQDHQAKNIDDATLVRLRFTNTSQEELSRTELVLPNVGGGIYRASGTDLSQPGEWKVRTTIKRPDVFDTITDFSLTLETPSAVGQQPLSHPRMPHSGRVTILFIIGVIALIIGGDMAMRDRKTTWLSPRILALLLCGVGVVFLLSGVAALYSQITERVYVTDAVVGATESVTGSLSTAAAYLVIHNNTAENQQLISATTDAAESVTVHETQIQQEVASMTLLEDVVIPPYDKLRLEPGGMHIMLDDLTRPLRQGEVIILTLRFASGLTVPVEVNVGQP
jgi:copper transport protein